MIGNPKKQATNPKGNNMKLKKSDLSMKAVLPVNDSEYRNGRNYGDTKEKVSQWLVIDKKTERTIIDCRVYMGRSSNSSQVYASIWIHGINYYIAGCGVVGGYGYHKESAAIQSAISLAGVKLFGSPYRHGDSKPDFKKQCYIDGVGSSAIDSAFKAIAYALGYRDVIVVEC